MHYTISMNRLLVALVFVFNSYQYAAQQVVVQDNEPLSLQYRIVANYILNACDQVSREVDISQVPVLFRIYGSSSWFEQRVDFSDKVLISCWNDKGSEQFLQIPRESILRPYRDHFSGFYSRCNGLERYSITDDLDQDVVRFGWFQDQRLSNSAQL